MEQLEHSQNQTVDCEAGKEDSEEAVEFLIEVKVPCLICGADIEINNIIKQEVPELDEDSDDNEGVDGSNNIDYCVFHSFLKWFRVNIVRKGRQRLEERGWDGEGGDILRFCGNCKMEVMGILEFHKQRDELEEKIKNGLREMKGKMERFEEAFQGNGVYEKDKRYKLVRSQIVKHVSENSETSPQDNIKPLPGQPIDYKRITRRSPRIKATPNSATTDDALLVIDKAQRLMVSSVDKGTQCQLISNIPDTRSDNSSDILDTCQHARNAGTKKIVKGNGSTQRPAKPVHEQTQKSRRPVRRTSSRNKEKAVPDKVQSPKLTQVAKGIVQKKVGRPNSSKIYKKFGCSKCSFKSTHKTRLDAHIQTVHNGILEKCPKCGKSYAYLKHHMRHQHGNLKRIKCTERGCKKTFKTQANLKEHINAVHRKLRPWKCTECGREFAWKVPFEAHMNLHKGIRPFKCEEEGCGAAFSRKCSLKKHHSSYHEGGSKPKRICYLKGPAVLEVGLVKH